MKKITMVCITVGSIHVCLSIIYHLIYLSVCLPIQLASWEDIFSDLYLL